MSNTQLKIKQSVNIVCLSVVWYDGFTPSHNTDRFFFKTRELAIEGWNQIKHTYPDDAQNYIGVEKLIEELE